MGRAKSFRLLLQSPGDAVVEKTPPLCTHWGIARIVGFLVAIILAVRLWISILHGRIAALSAQKV